LKINVYSIQKKTSDEFSILNAEFIKMSKKFATVNDIQIFTPLISKAQTQNEQVAKKSYTQTYEPFLQNGYNIALDVLGKKVDSFGFASLLQDKIEVNFFVGGAYGFEDEFLKKCDFVIGLSSLTMPHKLAHLILVEQIFRGLSINNNHPYHK